MYSTINTYRKSGNAQALEGMARMNIASCLCSRLSVRDLEPSHGSDSGSSSGLLAFVFRRESFEYSHRFPLVSTSGREVLADRVTIQRRIVRNKFCTDPIHTMQYSSPGLGCRVRDRLPLEANDRLFGPPSLVQWDQSNLSREVASSDGYLESQSAGFGLCCTGSGSAVTQLRDSHNFRRVIDGSTPLRGWLRSR